MFELVSQSFLGVLAGWCSLAFWRFISLLAFSVLGGFSVGCAQDFAIDFRFLSSGPSDLLSGQRHSQCWLGYALILAAARLRRLLRGMRLPRHL